MTQTLLATAVSFALVAVSFSANAADSLPRKIGDCARTKVSKIETRLEGAPGSGSAIVFANGLYQVSYDQVDAIDQSKPGDPVSICLIKLPEDCPPGDDRGKVYKTVNLRSNKSWVLADSEHVCGGA